MSASSGAPLRVFVAARWYPAHDDVGRGIFVADLVRALGAAHVEQFVASWELALAREVAGRGGARLAADRWAAVAPLAEPAAPRSWGAPGVSVVRLPAIVPTLADVPRDSIELAAFQAATLVPFGTALFRRWRFDIVHAHTGVPDGLAAAELADRLGLPLLVTEHDSSLAERLAEDRIRAAYLGLLEGRHRVVAVSPSMRADLARLLGVERERIGVVPNPVDIDAFAIRDAPIERDQGELLWVGSRKASKGMDVLLRAFALVRGEREALHLRLIGSPAGADGEARLRALAGELGIAGAVAFEPAADRPAVAAAMARASVFVHPSPRETFGVVAAEALASGLPVATTPSGGVSDIVGTDRTCGTIAAALDEEALAGAILDLLDRRSLLDPVSMRARAAAFAPAVVAAATIAEYRGLLAAGAGRAEMSGAEAGGAEAGGSDTGTSAAGGAGIAGPAFPTEPASEAVPSSGPSLIVGLNRRAAAARLATVPSALAGALEIVTSVAGPKGGDPLPPGRWHEIDAERAYRAAVVAAGGPLAAAPSVRRLGRALLHPVRALRLRRLAGRRSSMLAAERSAAIDSVIVARTSRGLPKGPIVALDADDVVALGPLLDRGVALDPGTLRSLVDRWDAAGRPLAADPAD